MNEGTTAYCGDNCNHTGPHHYPPPPPLTIMPTLTFVYCPHGLDMRIYPRCYLCRPVEPVPFTEEAGLCRLAMESGLSGGEG